MTTGISLVRENAESMQPPRSLWVSFPLGRPLGKPGDAAFQHRVIDAALDLLERESGPVLEDFPEDAPAVEPTSAPTCPVSFARPGEDSNTWADRLAREIAELQPWYEFGRRRRNGRTLVGVNEHPPAENVASVGRLLDEDQLPLTNMPWFKSAIQDLKAYYLEALTAQPGDYDHEQVQKTLWRETALGAALIEFYDRFRSQDDKRLRLIARIIVPREAVDEATGEELTLSSAPEQK
jgi:D-proline reductase (dithiol) PrdB